MTTAAGDAPVRFAPTRLLALALSIGVAVVLVQAALDLSDEPGGLTTLVAERMEDSGVKHPVTAVLLNFRGYDTFFEVAVLALAVLGVLAVRRDRDLWAARVVPYSRLHHDPMMDWLVRLLAPLLVLAGGYMLWLGTSAPGGAFQAGAVLAAAGVMMRLAGRPLVASLRGGRFRLALLAGFLVFLLASLTTMLFNSNLLQLPRNGAGLITLAIETTVTVSIAVTLVSLYVGAEPQSAEEEREQP
jgi:multisubunit Na+/H+ antiporter MnhB subunit